MLQDDSNTAASLEGIAIMCDLRKLAETVSQTTGKKYSLTYIPGKETQDGLRIEPMLIMRETGTHPRNAYIPEGYSLDDPSLVVILGINNAKGKRENVAINVDIRDHSIADQVRELFDKHAGDVGDITYRVAR